MAAIQAIVNGRVQGVGFRWFVRGEAHRLGLRGQVRNLPSGDQVEVLAQGEQGELDQLVAALRRGPVLSRVLSVDVQPLSGSQDFPDFNITF